jgi:hypothetical protein
VAAVEVVVVQQQVDAVDTVDNMMLSWRCGHIVQTASNYFNHGSGTSTSDCFKINPCVAQYK